MSEAGEIRIEVVFALAERAWRVPLQLPAGATVAAALTASGLRERVAECRYDPDLLAIFGKPVDMGRVLRDGDRVEILRPLLIDPKQARRARAARNPLARKPRIR